MMTSYRVFTEMSELLAYAKEDKHSEGAGSAQRNRYPIRFVLFENFTDFYEFVNSINSAFPEEVYTLGVEKWIDRDLSDTLITSNELGRQIVGFVKKLPTNDVVIAPFSEMARFYDNIRGCEFESLVRTIRLAEPPQESQSRHQRIYIPIIGMQGKMGEFFKDPNIHIWELRPDKPTDNYRLILTRGTTYGVKGIDEQHTLCHNLREWLQLWKKPEQIKRDIVCSSRSLYDNSGNAQPDNAFSYVVCHNAFEFLTKGLGIDFGNIPYRESDAQNWELLAGKTDVTDFCFDTFINRHFGTFAVANATDFARAWFDCETSFDHWLLSVYYQMKFGGADYLGKTLAAVETLTTSELFSMLAIGIFGESQQERYISQRKALLTEAAKHNVIITDHAEQRLKSKLQAVAADPTRGYYTAVKLLTPLTKAEKLLMVEWVGRGHISLHDIQSNYPQLYGYLHPCQIKSSISWINPYMEQYRQSKIGNTASDGIAQMIADHNGNATRFRGWYDDVKTLKTLLGNRPDVDIVYWIDGLGIDWIPFVTDLVNRHVHDGVYLNEVYIAAAELPTRTENNKQQIKAVAGERMQKIGDIDNYAHTQKTYPGYIVEELQIVENAIEGVLSQYNGKKIAFVSDHGITYLSQLSQGLNLAGVETDHAGRVATRKSALASADSNYLTLDDGKTMCALGHKSLGAKVNNGLGAHGGATPEEALVPVIIVSGQRNANNFTAKIVKDDLTGNNPVTVFSIKGLSSVDVPEIEYNGIAYSLYDKGAGTYESERLNLVDTCKTVVLKIGETYVRRFAVTVNTGVQEEDLFGDL